MKTANIPRPVFREERGRTSDYKATHGILEAQAHTIHSQFTRGFPGVRNLAATSVMSHEVTSMS